MSPSLMLYGANGFLGEVISRLAVKSGLQPILAGRDEVKIKKLATELDLEYRIFNLHDPQTIDQSLKNVTVILHCAGPYINTYRPIVEACLRKGTHYLDLTGEIPVYEALAALDSEAKSCGIMLLPGVGFDVVPTDCLAKHLKHRLPSASRLTLAFQSVGPAGLPPGTQRTMIDLIPYGDRVRRNGALEVPERAQITRLIDFDKGLVKATRFTWGDVFTAFYSTNIPNIEDYVVLSEDMRRQMTMISYLRPLFKTTMVRNILKRGVKPGPSEIEQSQTFTHVWGEVEDDNKQKAISRLHGPEAGVVWTSRSAVAAVQKVFTGKAPLGFQTPALAFGADFVMDCEGVTREDLI